MSDPQADPPADAGADLDALLAAMIQGGSREETDPKGEPVGPEAADAEGAANRNSQDLAQRLFDDLAATMPAEMRIHSTSAIGEAAEGDAASKAAAEASVPGDDPEADNPDAESAKEGDRDATAGDDSASDPAADAAGLETEQALDATEAMDDHADDATPEARDPETDVRPAEAVETVEVDEAPEAPAPTTPAPATNAMPMMMTPVAPLAAGGGGSGPVVIPITVEVNVDEERRDGEARIKVGTQRDGSGFRYIKQEPEDATAEEEETAEFSLEDALAEAERLVKEGGLIPLTEVEDSFGDKDSELPGSNAAAPTQAAPTQAAPTQAAPVQAAHTQAAPAQAPAPAEVEDAPHAGAEGEAPDPYTSEAGPAGADQASPQPEAEAEADDGADMGVLADAAATDRYDDGETPDLGRWVDFDELRPGYSPTLKVLKALIERGRGGRGGGRAGGMADLGEEDILASSILPAPPLDAKTRLLRHLQERFEHLMRERLEDLSPELAEAVEGVALKVDLTLSFGSVSMHADDRGRLHGEATQGAG